MVAEPARGWRGILTQCAVLSLAALGPLPGAPRWLPSPMPEQVEHHLTLGGRADASSSVLRQQEKATEAIFERNTPSVVYISTFAQRYNALDLNAMVEVPQGTGSGFAWDSKGHIVTNYHVIRNANEAKVTITGKKGLRTVYTAKLVGANPDKDVAVLELVPGDANKGSPVRTVPIQLGSSSALKVGQTVFAIGNPYGLDHTMTSGIVSGLGREMVSPSGRPISNVIQTDAAINPGNSGGVLLDVDGRLVGMNTAIYSPSGTSAGIGFAIPVDTLATQVESLLTRGRATRAVIGISVLDGAQARVLGIPQGVLVLKVPEGSEAERAGLRGSMRDSEGSVVIGDVIVECDGRSVGSEADLFKALDTHAPGDVVKVKVLRSKPNAGQAALGAIVDGSSGGDSFINTKDLEEKMLSIKLSAVDVAGPAPGSGGGALPPTPAPGLAPAPPRGGR